MTSDNSKNDQRSGLPPFKRRAQPILPERKKLRYKDGTPILVSPLSKLRSIIHKAKDLYQYTPLKEGEDIRILILERGEPSSPLVCRLLPCALPGADPKSPDIPVASYEALSYFWGQEALPTMTITITRPSLQPMENTVQKKFFIRPNLHAALVELRKAGDEVRLWVDAICIHQEDSVEKTAQVSMMHKIYSKANSICIWLGVGDFNPETGKIDPANTKATFSFIKEMLRLERLDELVEDKKYAKGWYSFVELMRNRWFSRRWVVQELALAKEATVHYGEEYMLWSDFADAVALFVTKHDEINALLRTYYTEDDDPIGDMRALGANTLVEATNNLFRKSNGEIGERLVTLEVIVSSMLAFEATNPKDTIYAVLSIASDTPYAYSKMTSPETLVSNQDDRIVPNYEKNKVEIFVDFIDYCIEKSGSLDMICRHWAPAPRRNPVTPDPDVRLSMPSWVSIITASAFGGPELMLEGRCNGDSLVGIPSRRNNQNYNASGGHKPSYRIEKLADSSVAPTTNGTDQIADQSPPNTPFQGGHSRVSRGEPKASETQPTNFVLHVKGVRLDFIDQLSPRVAGGSIHQECLEMGGWVPSRWDDTDRPEKVPDALWRTMVADRDPNGKNAPSWYHRACLDCFAHITYNRVLNITTLLNKPTTASTLVRFLKRVQEVVWNRKFLSSRGCRYGNEEKKLFGLAPESARRGDLICLLFGCSVPVILRQMGPADNRYYTFVGEAYVHGIMDGEALPTMLEPPYDGCTEFNIR